MCFTWILRLGLLYVTLNVAGCCMKPASSGSGMKPTTSGSDAGGGGIRPVTTQPATTIGGPQNNRLPCTNAEEVAIECLNGGTCFATLNANSIRQTQCQCTEEWTSTHCEERSAGIYLGSSISQAGGNTAIILGSIGFFVFLVIIGVIVAVVFIRRKRIRKRKSMNATDYLKHQAENADNAPIQPEKIKKIAKSIVHGSKKPKRPQTVAGYVAANPDSLSTVDLSPPCSEYTYEDSRDQLVYRENALKPAPDRCSVSSAVFSGSVISQPYSQYSRSSHVPMRAHETSM